MKKGNFGLPLAAVAAIAFAFAALAQPLAVLLICGFALLAERDGWLNKQTLQALLLTMTYYLTILVTGWVFGGMARFFNWVKAYQAGRVMSTADSVVGNILYVAFIALCVYAILRVLRGKDAGLPFLSQMAEGGFTAQGKAPGKAPASPAQQAQPQQTVPSAAFCSSCGASLGDDAAFCSECGTKTK